MLTMKIYKTFRFDSAHHLTGVPPTHKCFGMHGHGYVLEVHVKGDVDPQTGFVIDYSDISDICDPLVRDLDHKVLNDIEGLENPTSENLCIWIWDKIKPKLPLLYKLVIKATESSGGVYKG